MRNWLYVKHMLLVTFLLVLLFPVFLPAQRGRRTAPGGSMNPAPMKGVVISVRGRLKELTKKTIVIQADDNQIMTIRRSSKTKFLSGDKEIKPFEIDLDNMVAIDVTEDNDLKLIAIAVRLDAAQSKRPLGSR